MIPHFSKDPQPHVFSKDPQPHVFSKDPQDFFKNINTIVTLRIYRVWFV